MTRPGVIAADPSKPLATEAHPNPSIPEAAEESASKGENFFYGRIKILSEGES